MFIEDSDEKLWMVGCVDSRYVFDERNAKKLWKDVRKMVGVANDGEEIFHTTETWTILSGIVGTATSRMSHFKRSIFRYQNCSGFSSPRSFIPVMCFPPCMLPMVAFAALSLMSLSYTPMASAVTPFCRTLDSILAS